MGTIGGWELAVAEPGRVTTPDEAAALDWIPALVPGTAAAALAAAGRFDPTHPMPLHDRDIWYRATLSGAGRERLTFAGLATLADVLVDGRLVATSESMFLPLTVDLDLAGGHTLLIRFRALEPAFAAKGPRARWRPRMMDTQGLRVVRTTALGHMPGWCPSIHAVGPYRPVTLAPAPVVWGVRFAARPGTLATGIDPSPCPFPTRGEGTLVEGGADRKSSQSPQSRPLPLCGVGTGRGVDGRLSISLRSTAKQVVLHCAGRSTPLTCDGDRFSGELLLENVELWWPHTHGEPALYDVEVEVDGARLPLGRVGFRTIEADHDRFALRVNGVPVFCRGAVWTGHDVLGLAGTREAYAPLLTRARDAGMNMIRVAGTGVYETPAFFDLCDELGILVWQDFMFANFDYPRDAAFLERCRREAEAFLGGVAASPSLAVLCGGSEVFQQATMLGLPPEATAHPLFDRVLPAAAAALRPDVPYVANSPSGGALPFLPGAGVAHYYGVGAYLRPVEDARRADVSFAAECLAFANLPAADSGLDGSAGVPRDIGADWDFADVRDHYLGRLRGVDPAQLREDDPERWHELGREVTGAVMEAVFAEWRRVGSQTAGGLVLALKDLMPGAGWGVIDVSGRPKPAYFALKRAFRPVQVLLLDEGTNGLDVHLINETPDEVEATLELTALAGERPVIDVRAPLVLAPRSAERHSAYTLAGAFFDFTDAYRFGPPAHDLTVARLVGHDGATLAEALHRPAPRRP